MNAKGQADLKALIGQLLVSIGEDPQREGLVRTPERVALAWQHLAGGYDLTLNDVVGGACFDEDYNEMVTVKNIDFFSMCEHHLLPFFGRAHVGYIPNGRVIGLSKIPRIVEMYARRLQLQERLTLQIGNALMEVLKPQGVGVVIEGTHMCMQMRGVEKQNSFATTSHMVGIFETNQKTREEFMNIIALGRI